MTCMGQVPHWDQLLLLTQPELPGHILSVILTLPVGSLCPLSLAAISCPIGQRRQHRSSCGNSNEWRGHWAKPWLLPMPQFTLPNSHCGECHTLEALHRKCQKSLGHGHCHKHGISSVILLFRKAAAHDSLTIFIDLEKETSISSHS